MGVGHLGVGLLLWDVDGTLVKSSPSKGLATHIRALGLLDDFAESKALGMTGQTDWQILENISLNLPETQQSIIDLKKAFLEIDRIFDEDVQAGRKIVALPGITPASISSLKPRWDSGILTGNTSSRMRVKLREAGLFTCFDSSVMFTCEFGDSRENILERAIKELESSKYSDIIIVGDTPYDIKIAKDFGLPIISVATGKYDSEVLKLDDPDLIVENFLRDHTKFLEFLKKII